MRIPHVCVHPALTERNSPPGGEAWPSSSSPQQTTEPSSCTAQVWNLPALTEGVGVGGVAIGLDLDQVIGLKPGHHQGALVSANDTR